MTIEMWKTENSSYDVARGIDSIVSVIMVLYLWYIYGIFMVLVIKEEWLPYFIVSVGIAQKKC